MEVDYISVRFKDNHSKRWDGGGGGSREDGGQVGGVDGRGVGAGTSSLAGEGGKSRGKIWNCVVLALVTSDPEADDETVPTTSRRASRGKYKLERELAELGRQRTAHELSAAAESASASASNLPPQSTSAVVPIPPTTTSPATRCGKHLKKPTRGRGRETGTYTYACIYVATNHALI